MATVSNLPPRKAKSADPPGAAERLLSMIDDGHVVGAGLAGLGGGRGDDFNFAGLEAVVRPIRPECVEPLHRLLDARRLSRSSAEVKKCLLARVCVFAGKLGIDPFGATFDQAADFLEAYRDRGGMEGGPMAASACRNVRNALVLLHVVAGSPNPFHANGEMPARLIDELLSSWESEDADATGGRRDAVGVVKWDPVPSVGYFTGTPVTIGHVARLNSRSGGRLNRVLLREQARVLVVRETHAELPRLGLMRTVDVECGADPCIWLQTRADGTGGRDRHEISRPLARVLRLLIDDVVNVAGREVGADVALFQGLIGGGGGKTWSGERTYYHERIALRAMLIAAADQARIRGENNVGASEEVERFVAKVTYESIRDGLLFDCHSAGVPKVALALFLRRRRIVEIDNLYRREDQRGGAAREGRQW